MELLAVVEAAALAHGGIVIEGYGLPRDPRLHQIVVAPDPGVIEVNVHPATSWPQLVDITTTLYAEARAARLGTEKFQLDGTHTGTGGGNHITLGGPTPADSPLLRRPDLLQSLVTFWQHHPSLSYLFSGPFIGPTSQAPRVDEGRSENLVELDRAEPSVSLSTLNPGWSTCCCASARRHQATHRRVLSTSCSADSERRPACLRLRVLEMPPHPQMALAGLSARVSRFWDEPLRHSCVGAPSSTIGSSCRGTSHPTSPMSRRPASARVRLRPRVVGPVLRVPVARDRLRAGGRHHHRAAPRDRTVERPRRGGRRHRHRAVCRLVGRAAPGTRRGTHRARHVVTCNGRPVRCSPRVPEVRRRRALPRLATTVRAHPTIGVHAPLVFDLIDRWSGRSLGGCTCTWCPGGRSYDRFPVNANEAEARRTSRFEAFGHSTGELDTAPVPVVDAPADDEYPRTLDLRRSRPFTPTTPPPTRLR
jgi:uncharacterized protein (DUF2126 family)